ncbi:MAG TPA: cyclic nucleotide-binding domain-containing protein [Vicinamibacterales bacterium]|jgi:CRP-like cAMP-binding protein
MPDRASTRTDPLPVVSISEGARVFRTGDQADAFFIIQSGEVELLRASDDGQERLALLGAGELFGEDAVVEGQTRTCDARAIVAVTLLRLEPAVFTDLIRVRPDVATRVIGRLGARLNDARAACLAMARPVARPAATMAGAAAPPPPPPAIVSPRLVHVDTGRQFALPADALVGRADPRTKFQPDIELSAMDTHRSLSRRHARITRQPDGFFIVEEPRVANGTFLNGRRLTPGVATAMTDGDEVCFGLIKTVFRAS